MNEINFNSNAVIHEMMRCEGLSISAKSALKSIGSYIRLYCLTKDQKGYIFQINNNDNISNSIYLTLRVIKGSFHTTIWNTLARIDDEYALYYHENIEDLQNHLDKVDLLWSIKGVDPINAKISLGLIDWFLLRKVQASLNITCIGVLAFTKLLGRFLLSVPNYLKTRQYIAPMPATFMFNYLTVVCSCPLELSFPSIQQFLLHGEDAKSSSNNSSVSNKDLLQSLMQANGSGAWISGYLPVRQPSGCYHLLSKYAHLQQSVGNKFTAPPKENIPTIPEYFQQSTLAARTATPSTGGENPPHSSGVTPDPQSYALSMQCEFLLAVTAVRVVELLPHALGMHGLVVVLEAVHSQAWSAMQRFVALDAYKVAQAIRTGGHNMPSSQCSRIELLDERAWNNLNKALKQDLKSRSTEEERHISATAALHAAVQAITTATATTTTAVFPNVTTPVSAMGEMGTSMAFGVGTGDFPSRAPIDCRAGTTDFQSPAAAFRDDLPYSLPGSASMAQDSEYGDANDFFLSDEDTLIFTSFQPPDQDSGNTNRDLGNQDNELPRPAEDHTTENKSNVINSSPPPLPSSASPSHIHSSIMLTNNDKYNSNTTSTGIKSTYSAYANTMSVHINFNNTCEWGAPNKLQRVCDFYEELIKLLQK